MVLVEDVTDNPSASASSSSTTNNNNNSNSSQNRPSEVTVSRILRKMK